MSLAFEGPRGLARLDLPADSIIGFEHKPKSPREEKQMQARLKEFEKTFADQVQFSLDLSCQFTKVSVDVVFENSAHADLEAEYKIQCKRSPYSTKLDLNFLKTFPKLKTGQVDVLIDNLQKSFKVSPSQTSFELK